MEAAERTSSRYSGRIYGSPILSMGNSVLLIALSLLTSSKIVEENPDCSVNTVQMAHCASRSVERVEGELEVISQKAIAALEALDRSPEMQQFEPENVGNFRRSAQAWQEFREAHCRVVTSDSLGGTIYPLEFMSCKIQMTRERISQIRSDIFGQDD